MTSGGAQPQRGDLIQIFRDANFPPYEHWAVYVGEGKVVHKQKSLGFGRATVKKELLSKVAEGDKYQVNNKHDDKYKPRSPTEIILKAEKMVGREVPYSVLRQNCEHFANELRYGVSRSDQVKEAFFNPDGPDEFAAVTGSMMIPRKNQ